MHNETAPTEQLRRARRPKRSRFAALSGKCCLNFPAADRNSLLDCVPKFSDAPFGLISPETLGTSPRPVALDLFCRKANKTVDLRREKNMNETTTTFDQLQEQHHAVSRDSLARAIWSTIIEPGGQ